MFNANCFTYGFNQSLSDTVIAPTLTVARAAVIGWDACYAIATHRRTIKAVKITCWALFAAAVITYAMGQTVGIIARHWADNLVNECLEDAPAPAADVAEESAIVLVAPVVAPAPAPAPKAPAKGPTLAQLRKDCIAYNRTLPAGDPRRIARAGHLNRAQALAALGRI